MPAAVVRWKDSKLGSGSGGEVAAFSASRDRSLPPNERLVLHEP
jgi:hypothetical protein